MAQITIPEGAPAIGSFVSIPFSSARTQLPHRARFAQVLGYSRDGKTIKVRAWNGTQNYWMARPRRVLMGDWIKPQVAQVSARGVLLGYALYPLPPAI